MEVESVKYDFLNNVLRVGWGDGSFTTYTQSDKDKYVEDTGRQEDLETMGW